MHISFRWQDMYPLSGWAALGGFGLQKRILLIVALGLAAVLLVFGYLAVAAVQQSKDLVWSEKRPCFVDNSQAVGVAIGCQPDIGFDFSYGSGELSQVLRNRFRQSVHRGHKRIRKRKKRHKGERKSYRPCGHTGITIHQL